MARNTTASASAPIADAKAVRCRAAANDVMGHFRTNYARDEVWRVELGFLAFIPDFATERTVSMKSCAMGLGVRPFKTTIANARSVAGN